MRLPTVSGSQAEYTDARKGGALLLELTSQSALFGHDVLFDEVSALSATSLYLQLETGSPVVKLLNLTPLIATAADDRAAAQSNQAVLNYLAGIVADERLAPVAVLERTAALLATDAKERRLEERAQVFGRIERFAAAVGLRDFSALSRPSIHLCLDAVGGGEQSGVSWEVAEQHLPLAALALWWVPFEDEQRPRLFRPPPHATGAVHTRLAEAVPLPFSRVHPADTTGTFSFLDIERPAEPGATCGFSLALGVDPLFLDPREYARAVTGAMLGRAEQVAAASLPGGVGR